MVGMKWVLVEEYEYFNVWFNTKAGYKEAFFKNEDPNTMKRKRTLEDW